MLRNWVDFRNPCRSFGQANRRSAPRKAHGPPLLKDAYLLQNDVGIRETQFACLLCKRWVECRNESTLPALLKNRTRAPSVEFRQKRTPRRNFDAVSMARHFFD